MGLGGKLIDLGKQITEVVDQAVVDQDKALEIKKELILKIGELMLSGSGSHITKYTICGLTAIVVLTGVYTYLTGGDMEGYKTFALAISPMVGGLTGAYATATTIQRVQKNGK